MLILLENMFDFYFVAPKVAEGKREALSDKIKKTRKQ